MTLMQTYVANISISGSTLRNQGAPGVVTAARSFLATLDLNELTRMNPPRYHDWLNERTDELMERLPDRAQRWGTARKAINVFMVQAFLNKHLRDKFMLGRLGNMLETPLDSKAASGLRQHEPRLPRWNSIQGLSEQDSACYQRVAATLATQLRIPRACLDMTLWTPG